VDGRFLVWTDDRNGDYDLFLHDRIDGGTYPLITAPGDQILRPQRRSTPTKYPALLGLDRSNEHMAAAFTCLVIDITNSFLTAHIVCFAFSQRGSNARAI
jgi:hypothetical protein